jgi:TATA-binding protein-associated factor
MLRRANSADERHRIQATDAKHVAPVLPPAAPQASTSEVVVIAHRKTEGGEVKPTPVAAPNWSVPAGEWPFSKVADHLVANLTDAAWEVRHGAALGLRELLRHQVVGAGGLSAASRALWIDAVAVCLLTVLARDRFGDFVGDHMVAPVREAAAQALAILVKSASASSVQRIARVLFDLVHQKGASKYAWQVRHAALLGMQYLVAARADALQLTGEDQACRLADVVDVAILGCACASWV